MVFGGIFGKRAAPQGLSAPDFANGDIQGFWRWDAANGAVLRNALLAARSSAAVPEQMIVQVTAALHRIDPGLALEMGIDGDGDHELIISAEGVMSVFPSVIALASAAPHMPGHKVTSFRQRQHSSIKIEGRTIAPADVGYESAKDPDRERLDVIVYLPVPDDMDRRQLAQFGFLLLDCVLGEYDVATSLGGIEFALTSAASDRRLKPLPLLAEEVDALNCDRRAH